MALGILASAASYVVTAAAKANAEAAKQAKQYQLYLTTAQNDFTSKIAGSR
jgi:hypothetical protein